MSNKLEIFKNAIFNSSNVQFSPFPLANTAGITGTFVGRIMRKQVFMQRCCVYKLFQPC